MAATPAPRTARLRRALQPDRAAVDVDGWSIQYASATGTSWQVTPLTGTMPAGGALPGAGGRRPTPSAPLPTPDVSGSIAMAGERARSRWSPTTRRSPAPTTARGAAGVRDFVGYGATANDFEGTAPTRRRPTPRPPARRRRGRHRRQRHRLHRGRPGPETAASSPSRSRSTTSRARPPLAAGRAGRRATSPASSPPQQQRLLDAGPRARTPTRPPARASSSSPARPRQPTWCSVPPSSTGWSTSSAPAAHQHQPHHHRDHRRHRRGHRQHHAVAPR